ncbi:rhodanese-like domain-containing protein [Methyloversatilis thermotolerans]|uniref:rhodanese-like domain-containing protein n=1 Tax=Methyloversatilis thermotolerans TaxID=1346290 RepID=UPI00035F0692|nr:rhodanese-like domain-containing protein [Methyloversatilis thermotolerans]
MKTAHDLVVMARARVEEISLDEAELAIRDADALIDVREGDEYTTGHLAGALNIPRGVLEFRISAMPGLEGRDRTLVLYCKTGGRAALAACALHDMGYLNVKSIAGGIEAWSEAGKPVVRPAQPDFE